MMISSKDISSQEELLQALGKEGFELTQATLSRDLKQLKVAKAANMNGKYVYVLPNNIMYKRNNAQSASEMLMTSGFVSLHFSKNIAVIRTRPGYASSMAYDIDNRECPAILGTIAGDDQYAEQYCAIHNKDMYWTGEKVMQAQDRFHTFLAIRDGRVVGYIDVTCTFKENEPFDLFVPEEYRRMGYGRKLLAKALEANAPNAMSVLVDADNVPAIRLYASMGFAKKQNILTAHWTVPSSE